MTVYVVCSFAIAAVIGMFAWRSLSRYRDPFAPAVIFAPLLLYIYCYLPLAICWQEGWLNYPGLYSHLQIVGAVNLAGVFAFMLGLTWDRKKGSGEFSDIHLTDSWSQRRFLYRISLLLGFAAAGAFVYMVERGGGFISVFSRGKTFISGGSGYIGELPMLGYPAVVLLALAVRGQITEAKTQLLMFIYGSPHIMMAALGGRRGPAFQIIVTYAVAYFIIKQKTPALRTVLIGLGLTGVLMLFLFTQRREIYLGSDFEFNAERFSSIFFAKDAAPGHEAVVGAAGVAASDRLNVFFWGARYAVVLFVRPIPRQIWPNKYADCGMEWMVTAPGSYGISDLDWSRSVGFIPDRGNACGFITDMYIEFWWGMVIAVFLIGRSYSFVWSRMGTGNLYWLLLYFAMLAVSVYLPTQSVQAWLVRLLFVAVPTTLAWKLQGRSQ